MFDCQDLDINRARAPETPNSEDEDPLLGLFDPKSGWVLGLRALGERLSELSRSNAKDHEGRRTRSSNTSKVNSILTPTWATAWAWGLGISVFEVEVLRPQRRSPSSSPETPITTYLNLTPKCRPQDESRSAVISESTRAHAFSRTLLTTVPSCVQVRRSTSKCVSTPLV